MKPNGMTWWKLPENREWYRYITAWLYSGWLVILVWSLSSYAAWYFMYSDNPEYRLEGWGRLYRFWAITSLAGILVLSTAFFVFGIKKYKALTPRIFFSNLVRFGSFAALAVFLWLGTGFFFRREHYEPNLGLALFDASWMILLVTASFVPVHVVINWIARTYFESRNNVDV